MVQTPYSTVKPFFQDSASWVPEEEQDRISAYLQYDDMYWSAGEAFKISVADEDSEPIYVPKARTVVDTTAHYLLKGLTIAAPEGDAKMTEALTSILLREEFISRFHIAKHSGVARGDYLFHILADETKEPGSRISMISVHPSAYFPVYDTWDPDKLIKVHLAEQFEVREEGQLKTYIRKLTYEYTKDAGTSRVQVTEGAFEEKDWFDPKKQRLVKNLMKTRLLPPEITVIPVYHFTNGQWQGRDYGTSELAGFERLLQAINQTITDEEVALALEGLGVYATDAAGPVDQNSGQRIPWEIAPARVMEVPTGSYFKRVQGVGSVAPMLEHVKYLQDSLYEASGTSDIARGIVEVAVAQSGIALALKFLPTLAKVQERDAAGLGKLRQFWHDWKMWHKAFEGQDFGDAEPVIEIGDKLPTDKTAKLNELNNMFDRKVISAKFYRAEAQKLGYIFPDDIEEEIAAEAQTKFEDAQKLAMMNASLNPAPQEGETPGGPGNNAGVGKSGVAGRPKTPNNKRRNRSNNKGRPNESASSEAGK